MTGHKSQLRGYRLTKSGRLVPNKASLPVNKRIASRTRKKYKPAAKVPQQ